MLQLIINEDFKDYRNCLKSKKYSVHFGFNNTIYFSNKRSAFKFIADYTNIVTESLALCELIYTALNNYGQNLNSNSPSTRDAFVIFHTNQIEIQKTILELKCYHFGKVLVTKVDKFIHTLYSLLYSNIKIINKKVNNSALQLVGLIQGSARAYYASIANIQINYNGSPLSLFNDKKQ